MERFHKFRATAAIALSLLTAACASSSLRAPARIGEEPLRVRAITVEKNGIRVSAAVPKMEETLAAFGVNLEEKGIQPLWLEIVNGTDRGFSLLLSGLDPEYFAPLEAAYLFEDDFNDEGYKVLGEHFRAVYFDHRSPILPNDTVSGFVLVNAIYPTMIAEIDLVGNEWSQRLDLVVPMPGTEAAQLAAASLRWPLDESLIIETNDESELQAALESLPCCTNPDADNPNGLPLNLIVIGDIDDIAPAFVRRNFRYEREAPLYAFGRSHDLAARKISRWVVPQPYVIRAWRAPVRYKGHDVALAQVSMERGGRFADPDDASMAVDPNLDTVRDDVVQDFFYSQSLAKVGFVRAFGTVGPPDNSPYLTDGLRAVLLFSDEPVSLSAIDFFDWERLADYRTSAVRN